MISGLPVPSFPEELQRELLPGWSGRSSDRRGRTTRSPRLAWVYWRFYRRYLRRRRVRLRAPQPAPVRGLFLSGRQGSSPDRPWIAKAVDDGRLVAAREPRPVRNLVNLGFHLDARLRTVRAGRCRPGADPGAGRSAVWSGEPAEPDSAAIIASTGSTPSPNFQAAVPIRTYESLWDGLPARSLPRLRGPDLAGPHPLPGPDQRDDAGSDQVHPGLDGDGRVESEGRPDDAGLPLSLTPGFAALSGPALLPGRIGRASGGRPGRLGGRPERDRGRRARSFLRPFTFPPLELALESDWDRKLSRLAEQSRRRADHPGERGPELAADALPARARSRPASRR